MQYILYKKLSVAQLFKRKIYTIFLNCINLSLNLVRNRLYCSWSKYQIKTQPSTKYLIIVFILWNGYVSSKIQRVFCTIWIFASMVYVRTPFFIGSAQTPNFFRGCIYGFYVLKSLAERMTFDTNVSKVRLRLLLTKSKTKPYCNFILFFLFWYSFLRLKTQKRYPCT